MMYTLYLNMSSEHNGALCTSLFSSDHCPQSHFVSSDDQMGKDAHVL